MNKVTLHSLDDGTVEITTQNGSEVVDCAFAANLGAMLLAASHSPAATFDEYKTIALMFKAAPDLYETLRELLESCSKEASDDECGTPFRSVDGWAHINALVQARAALAKAEGESK